MLSIKFSFGRHLIENNCPNYYLGAEMNEIGAFLRLPIRHKMDLSLSSQCRQSQMDSRSQKNAICSKTDHPKSDKETLNTSLIKRIPASMRNREKASTILVILQ